MPDAVRHHPAWLLLLGDKLASILPSQASERAAAIIFLSGLIGWMGYQNLLCFAPVLQYIGFAVVLVVGFRITRRCCRRRRTIQRFMLRLPAWLILLSGILWPAGRLIQFLIDATKSRFHFSMIACVDVLWDGAFAGVVVGLGAYVLLMLPFVLLTLCSGTFRRRFEAVLRLNECDATPGDNP